MKALRISKYALRAIALCGAILSSVMAYQTGSERTGMNAKEFENWVIQMASSTQDSAQPPTFCQNVVNRLRANVHVTDRTVLRCVEAHIAAGENGARNAGADAAKHRFDAAEQFINELLPLLSDRDGLVAHLWDRKGSLAIALGDFQKATRSFQEALNIVEPLRLDFDLQRVTTLVKLGQSLISLNRKKDAEGYFLQALSYPWYTILNHPDEQRKLRDQYILAGYGLIESRRGNLEALQQIVFVPATMDKLGPALEKAVREAKGAK